MKEPPVRLASLPEKADTDGDQSNGNHDGRHRAPDAVDRFEVGIQHRAVVGRGLRESRGSGSDDERSEDEFLFHNEDAGFVFVF